MIWICHHISVTNLCLQNFFSDDFGAFRCYILCLILFNFIVPYQKRAIAMCSCYELITELNNMSKQIAYVEAYLISTPCPPLKTSWVYLHFVPLFYSTSHCEIPASMIFYVYHIWLQCEPLYNIHITIALHCFNVIVV